MPAHMRTPQTQPITTLTPQPTRPPPHIQPPQPPTPLCTPCCRGAVEFVEGEVRRLLTGRVGLSELAMTGGLWRVRRRGWACWEG